MFVFQLYMPAKTAGSTAFNDMRDIVESKNYSQDERNDAALDLVRRLKRAKDPLVYAYGLFSLGRFMSDYDVDPGHKNNLRPKLMELVNSDIFEEALPQIRQITKSSQLSLDEKDQIINTYLMMQNSLQKSSKQDLAGGDVTPQKVDQIDEGMNLFSPSGETVRDEKFDVGGVGVLVDNIRKKKPHFNPFNGNNFDLEVSETILSNRLVDVYDGSQGFFDFAKSQNLDLDTLEGNAKTYRAINAAFIRFKSYYDAAIQAQNPPSEAGRLKNLNPFQSDENLTNLCKFLLYISHDGAFTSEEKNMLQNNDVVGFVQSYTNRDGNDKRFSDFLTNSGVTEVNSSFRYKIGVGKFVLSNLDYVGKAGDDPKWFLGGAVSIYKTSASLDFATTDDLLQYSQKDPSITAGYSAFAGIFMPSLATWLEGQLEASERGIETFSLYGGNRSEQTGALGRHIGIGKNWSIEWGARADYALSGQQDSLSINFGDNLANYLSEDDLSRISIPHEEIDIDLGPTPSISKSKGSDSDYSMEVQIGTRAPVILDCLVISTDLGLRTSSQSGPQASTVFYLTPFTPKLHKYLDVSLKAGIRKDLNTRNMDGVFGVDLVGKLPNDISVNLNAQYLKTLEPALGAISYDLPMAEASVQVPFRTIGNLFR